MAADEERELAELREREEDAADERDREDREKEYGPNVTYVDPEWERRLLGKLGHD